MARKRKARGEGPPAEARRPIQGPIRDRIIGLRRVRAGDLRANPKNWRRHPDAQAAALREVLEEVGYAGVLLARETPDGLELIDGHLRAEVTPDAEVPVVVVDLDEREADLVLATHDPLGAMAEADAEALDALLRAVAPEGAAVQRMLSDLASEAGLYLGEDEGPGPTLADRFGAPPFSVLDARQGYWQDRKKSWLALGIQSELGRGQVLTWGVSPDGGDTHATPRKRKGARAYHQDIMRGEHVVGAHHESTPPHGPTVHKAADGTLVYEETWGTSIFDPVLCELVYCWFSPSGSVILDPFAGGSVRGVVAALLGRDYVGIDLRPEQVAANEEQWAAIGGTPRDRVAVRVSSKWAHHLFACSVSYITGTCKGGCCEGSDRVLVSLLPEEEESQRAAGYTVEDGLLVPDPCTGKCPHKRPDGLCAVHGTSLKPFGCIASPFTLNDGGTLIIRNRYSRMKCHGTGAPAYETFRASLDAIFGNAEAERICAALTAGETDPIANMSRRTYTHLRYLDDLKHGAAELPDEDPKQGTPRWIVGDGLDAATLAPGEYDLIFTCPPYADLEVYSDDPRDLSTMAYPEFLATYRRIIAASVGLLKQDSFACIVVGDIRDKAGNYRNFVSDTIAAFQDAGMHLYNEAILVTALGSLPIRVRKQFETSRKLGKTHQNVLVFVKGNGRRAADACGPVTIALVSPEEGLGEAAEDAALSE